MVHTIEQMKEVIKKLRRQAKVQDYLAVTIAYKNVGKNVRTAQGLPQMDFEKLQTVAWLLNFMKYGDDYNLFENQIKIQLCTTQFLI